MSYTLDFTISLGSTQTGLTLRAQLFDTSGTPTGSEISTGFTELGNGHYLWHYASIPDAHRGGVKFYESGSSSTPLAVCSINPEEGEYLDQKLSTTEGNIRGVDSDTLETLSDQLDVISTDISAIDPATAWDAEVASHQTTLTFGWFVNNGINTIDTVVDGIVVDIAALNNLSAAEVNTEVDTALADYDPPTKAELDSGLAGLNDLTAAEVNAEVDQALLDYDSPTKAEMDAGFAALNDFDPAVDQVIVATNNDKTGYSLSSAAIQAIWDALTSALITAGSIGKLLVDNINATISSRSTITTAEVNAEADQALADYDGPTKTEMDTAFAALNDFDPAVDQVIVGTNNDKTGYALSTAAILAIWHQHWSAIVDTDSVGYWLINLHDFDPAREDVNADLTTDAIQALWDKNYTELTTMNSIGKLLVNYESLINAIPGLVWEELYADHSSPSTIMGAVVGNISSMVYALPSTIENYIALSEANIRGGSESLETLMTAIDALNDLSAAEVNTEVDQALADYDAPTKAELDTAVSTIRGVDNDTLKTLSDQLDGAIGFDLSVEEIQSGWTYQDAWLVAISILAGKSSGGGSGTNIFRDLNDSKDVATFTVTNKGNRTGASYNP